MRLLVTDFVENIVEHLVSTSLYMVSSSLVRFGIGAVLNYTVMYTCMHLYTYTVCIEVHILRSFLCDFAPPPQ